MELGGLGHLGGEGVHHLRHPAGWRIVRLGRGQQDGQREQEGGQEEV